MDKGAVRKEMIGQLSALLTGPLAADEVLGSAPADTYLTGILWPRGATLSADEDDDAGNQGEGGGEDAETGVPGYRSVRPCSLGITFATDADANVTISLGETARYEPMPADGACDAEAGHDLQWVRRPLGYSIVLPCENTPAAWKTSTFTNMLGAEVTDDRIAVHIRRRVTDDQHVYTVTLINEATAGRNDGDLRDTHCLFQTGLVIRAHHGEGGPAIRPRPQPPLTADDEDALTNALLYRDVHEFAVGHGIATMWDTDAGGAVGEVRTAWLPAAVVQGTSAAGSSDLKKLKERHARVFYADFLGQEENRAGVITALRAFAACYGRWIKGKLKRRLPGFTGVLEDAARQNLKRCNETLERISDGIQVLKKDDDAWAAFSMANRAMDRQSLFPARGERAKPLSWRPFQLAFMLLVLPGLTDPDKPDRNCMDLLWFPTGGGKTEAYLGITAFQIFYRRLTDTGRRTEGGVDVLMRYTLRLLTVQQFQRAAALITACELMRATDRRLGQARITLGLYVGGDATPNKMKDARDALQAEQAGTLPKSTPRQLLRCPVCGTDLPSTAYTADPELPRIDIVCRHESCEVRGQPLPVLTVDDVLYAAPPSLLIGTVDKFAQVPRSTDLRQLFGIDGGLRPGLILQDELHLISGPLGSIAGLYETVIDLFCTHEGVRPKIIGSTATIGQAARQVRALFDRDVLQFPPPGFDAADSFFAVRDAAEPDRIYVGLPTAGRSPKFALQALVATLLQSAWTMHETGKAQDESIDPYWTCVAYFNSLRELGGAWVLMQDDVPRQMQFLSARLGSSRRPVEMEPVELSSRVPSRDLPAVLQSLEVSLDDTQAYQEPKDTVLASNMISVGVDVPRLGLMVVNGQPKSTAEYIQASSRVGRGMPGLVVTLYNFSRPRDLSHFEHFRSYHAALYRSVEATSVTPWAPRARDKALHAVVIAAIRHLVPGLAGAEDAVLFDPNVPAVKELIARIQARAAAASEDIETDETAADIAAVIAQWQRRSRDARNGQTRLLYWEKEAPFGKGAPHLMNSAEQGRQSGTLAWPTPNTMREVEPSTAFLLKRISRE